MISAEAFHNLRPEGKRQRIIEGLEHVNARYAELAVSVKKLNGWFNQIDIDHADTKYVQRFRKIAEDCEFNSDLLSEQILIASQKVKFINDHVAKHLIQNP